MGVCNVCNSIEETRKGKKVVRRNDDRESNKECSTKDKSDYLVSENITKKTDIRKSYKLSTEFIGKGASGEVLEGIDKNGKRYAIKRIDKFAIKSIEYLATEAEISLTLDHPHIIKCYEVYEDLKTISFVMDLIEGGDLFDFILKGPDGKLTDIVAFDLIHQIIETVHYLHEIKHIAHRDIKPENFLISIENGEPQIKIIDFGFACKIQPDKKMERNLGTPMYTAPEIVNREPYTEKVDMWAIGILLFNMVTGCQPFTSDSYITIEEQVCSKIISFEAIECEQLRSLCEHLLERDNEKRFSANQALEYVLNIKENFNIELMKKEFERLDPNKEGFLSVNQIQNAYQLRNFEFKNQLVDFTHFQALFSKISY